MLSRAVACSGLRLNLWPLSAAAYSTIVEQWVADNPVTIQQVPGAGRGVFAASNIAQGNTLLEEQPLVCTYGADEEDQACYNCVRSLDVGSRKRLRGRWFCSDACTSTAIAEYLPELEAHCDESGERFPLLAMRLACAALTRALQPLALCAPAARHPWRGDPLTDLRLLAFANIPRPPPQPWQDVYALLRRGIARFAASASGRAQPAVAEAASRLDLEWYTGVMARLHVNAFRIDTARMPSREKSLAALAAAVVAGASGAGGRATGSALYLLGSLFNHSCVPNLDVLFPTSDGMLRLRAARDIAAGEQLCIAYLDVDLPVERRQEKLSFGYGFTCACPRCLEEL